MKAKEMSSVYWFCQSAEWGGFAPASIQTRVSAPTLSRAVAQLEDRLGEKLVHRNAKQFQLTAAGEDYYRRFAPIFQQLDEEWEQLSSLQSELTGDIRVSCPEPFADSFLQQAAFDFMKDHPAVNIHIDFSSDTNTFFDDQIDLAISTNPPQAPHLVQRRLFDMELGLAASPGYLSEYGWPSDTSDLLSHRLLAGNKIPFWEFRESGQIVRIPIKPRYSIDSLRLIINAACKGLGLCLIPKVLLAQLAERDRLTEVLPAVGCPTGIVYMVWADRKLVSARVAAFRDLITERMAQPWEFLSSVSRLNADN
ncbi:LysR family transcriptional regulator [Marinobacter sp. V034]